ncbi:MAG: methanogenesis marker protein Mmp4/MtxX [Methanomicrobiales archaeon]|nr:methanogenesis marker protein Mmp4/MtxX [Methanomicrobiales archaeon]
MIIGIGIGDEAQKVWQSLQELGHRFHIRWYLREESSKAPSIKGYEGVISPHPEVDLIRDLMEGRIQGAVRGTLPANETLRELKRCTGVDHLERIALLETAGGTKFLLAPVGVDEGWTIEQKLALIEKGRAIAQRFGLTGGVGILSGGRRGDIGRHAVVDRSIAEAEHLARLSGAHHYEILIEEAVGNCSLIIAPDGISGNLIFRTLIFLGGGIGHGAPVVNIDKVFVDTSRASPNYTKALLLAASLADAAKENNITGKL